MLVFFSFLPFILLESYFQSSFSYVFTILTSSCPLTPQLFIIFHLFKLFRSSLAFNFSPFLPPFAILTSSCLLNLQLFAFFQHSYSFMHFRQYVQQISLQPSAFTLYLRRKNNFFLVIPDSVHFSASISSYKF